MKIKKQKESIPRSICWVLTGVLRVLTGISIILILIVMPFYFQEGYNHIGSDKSYFFRTGAVKMGKLILPVFLLWIISSAIATFPKRHKGMLREWKQTLSVTDWLAFFFGIAAIFSYICSRYQDTALWGTKGWYMGLIPQLTLIAIYFLVSRFQFHHAAKWLFGFSLPVSATVFLLGCLNRFDVWPIPMENSGLPGFISTIGNINWYCGYAVAIGFVGVGLLWLDRGNRRWYTILLCAHVLLFFSTLITQGSDSGIFALTLVFLAMFLISVKDGDSRRLKGFWLLVLLLAGAGLLIMGLRLFMPGRMNYFSRLTDLLTYSPIPVVLTVLASVGLWCGRFGDFRLDDASAKAAGLYWKVLNIAAKLICVGVPVAVVVFVLMITVNTLRPGSLGPLSERPVFTFNAEWGSKRGATWSVGARCFWEQDLLHKLLGVGPDCMADFLYSAGGIEGASAALTEDARAMFVNQRLTNAHGELLTVLVDMGILGMLTFGGMLFSAVGRFLRARGQNCFAAACGLCVLAYLANNIWSFQQSMSLATIAVVLGMGEWFLRAEKKRFPPRKQ